MDSIAGFAPLDRRDVDRNRRREHRAACACGRAGLRPRPVASNFSADITFDGDGLVVDYPGIGRRL
jgi:hypothetical protein